MLGNGRLEAHCFDGVRRLCHIRGKMRKRVWVNAGDIVLISLREFQDNKGDVIAKCIYTPNNTHTIPIPAPPPPLAAAAAAVCVCCM